MPEWNKFYLVLGFLMMSCVPLFLLGILLPFISRFTTYPLLLRRCTPKYWRGYPGRLLTDRIHDYLFILMLLLPLLAAAFISAFFNLFSFLEDNQGIYLFGFLISVAFAGLCVYFGKKILSVSDVIPRIVPYFKKRVGEKTDRVSDAFHQGQALAKNCKFLDGLAYQSGDKGLSDFGFRDDYYSENVIWHKPQEGIQMVCKLLEKVKKSSDQIEDLESITTELKAIEEALTKAEEKEVQFCFLVRVGAEHEIFIREMEQRTGVFW